MAARPTPDLPVSTDPSGRRTSLRRLCRPNAGQTLAVIDAATGEIRRAQIYVAVLGASNYTYACIHIRTRDRRGRARQQLRTESPQAGSDRGRPATISLSPSIRPTMSPSTKLKFRQAENELPLFDQALGLNSGFRLLPTV